MFSGFRTGIAALTLLLAPTLAGAATMNFDTSSDLFFDTAENQGAWRVDGSHAAGNDNYFTGVNTSSTSRSFFSFKLTGLAGKVITGVEFQVKRYEQNAEGHLALFDVSTAASTLMNNGFNRLDIYQDLGSGNSYGGADLALGAATDVLSFVLSAQAVADANAAREGWFSIGADFVAPGTGRRYFGAFSGSELTNASRPQSLQRLVVTYADAPVPLPASLPLLGAGMAGLVALRRRKKA